MRRTSGPCWATTRHDRFEDLDLVEVAVSARRGQLGQDLCKCRQGPCVEIDPGERLAERGGERHVG